MTEQQIRDDLQVGTKVMRRLFLDARESARRLTTELQERLRQPNRSDEFLKRAEGIIRELAEG